MARDNTPTSHKIASVEQKNYSDRAAQLIDDIISSIEFCDKEYLVDIDYSNEILTIDVSESVFIINRQNAREEIWLSSPISGPYHFYFKDNIWQNHKNQSIKQVISQELSDLTEQTIEIR